MLSEEMPMNQLTLSGFDEELTHRIRHFANQEGISLNQAAKRLGIDESTVRRNR